MATNCANVTDAGSTGRSAQWRTGMRAIDSEQRKWTRTHVLAPWQSLSGSFTDNGCKRTRTEEALQRILRPKQTDADAQTNELARRAKGRLDRTLSDVAYLFLCFVSSFFWLPKIIFV